MLQLYHVAGSSNSQRVRIVLTEKEIPWESHQLTQSAELHTAEFRAISPSGTVPALVHDGRSLVDSVVINEYLEDVFPARPLRPADPYLAGRMRQWVKHADDYWQRSIAVFTHALTRREAVLAAYDGDLDAALASITDPIILSWRRSVYRDGLASPHALEAMRLITASLAQLDAALQGEEWLVNGRFTLAEAALLPAVFRLQCLAMDFLWIFCGATRHRSSRRCPPRTCAISLARQRRSKRCKMTLHGPPERKARRPCTRRRTYRIRSC
ncbi:MAG: glutathione S-transferase family protein [Caldilineaceae bacterium]|nr:glutathione S-transferase family protein [Caldilineaceae bacterium]